MAWEWLDTIQGLTGDICEPGGINTTWDYVLEHIGNPNTYGVSIATSNNYQNPPASLTGSEGSFFHNFETTLADETYTTDWGFTIEYKYSSGTGGNTSGSASWKHNGHEGGVGGLNMRIGVRFAIDRSREIAVMVVARYFYNGAYYCDIWATWGEWYNPDTQQRENTAPYLYQLLMGHVPSPYTWSSVSSVTGKNGILSLTQILNINDGEPVENVTNRGNLDFSKKTKVNTLVNSVYEPTYKEDQTKATVEYEIPEAEYQYTKLVYKKKKIPKSASDGTAIDIGADDTEVVVTNLEPSTVYYFVVFTNRTKSNAYKFKTGHNAPEEGILKLKVTIDKALLDNDIKDFVSYEKLT